MRTGAILSLLVVMSLGACATEMTGSPQTHLTEAVAHTKEAIKYGKAGYAYALSQHAQIALQHAEAAQKDLKDDRHLEKGIKKLNQAIVDGRTNDVLDGTKAAEEALAHLNALVKEWADQAPQK